MSTHWAQCCVQAALCKSDLLVTVSPNYAREIQTDEGMACGMRDVLCSRGIWFASLFLNPKPCLLP